MPIRLISYLITLLVMIVLGVFVYASNTKGRVNRAFGLFTLAADIWIIALAIADNTKSLSLVNLGARLAFISSTLTLFMVVVFTLAMANPKKKNTTTIIWFAVPALALILTAPTRLAIESVSIQSYGAGVNGGWAYEALSAYIAICLGAAIVILVRGIKRAQPITKTQLLYLLIGLTITGIIAAVTNLVLVNYAFLGPPAYLVFAGFTAYAVVKHRLFNVRAVVARSVAYILLLTTLAILYGASIFGISHFLLPTATASLTQNVVYVALAVVLAFTFQPLKRFFEQITDRIFFRDRYDSQVVLNRIGQILVAEFQLDRLLQRTIKEICESLRIASGQLYIFDQDQVYKVEHYGTLPAKLITAPHLKSLRHRVVVADELPSGHEKDVMQEFGHRVVLHLDTKEEFVGYLLLGDKRNGDIYTSQDITLLEILVQELAVAISNAKAYEDIAQFNVTLQQKIDDATKKLTVANKNLKELDEAKDEFISMASHQLRTPLTSIKGYLSMVLEGDVGTITPQQEEFLNYAFTGAQRTVNMIADLLNVSRMTAGKFFIEKKEVDLTKLTAEEVQQLQQMAESRQLTLKFVPPKKPLPTMQLDEGKTRQVVMNFVDNALHYTKKGDVQVSLEQVGKNAELRVKDSGIGVPKDARDHLFSKFFRAGNAQTARPDGTGLGLFLAKRVVEDQGGTIIFESVEGKGSTFGFSIPLIVKESRGTRKQPAGK